MKSNYYQKLKDPRWQKKRLEILERDEWQCRGCRNKSETLAVHHGFYKKNTDPWDYPNESLWTMCSPCHERAQEYLAKVHSLIGMLHPFLLWDLCEFLKEHIECPGMQFGDMIELRQWAQRSHFDLCYYYAGSIGGIVKTEVKGVAGPPPECEMISLEQILSNPP